MLRVGAPLHNSNTSSDESPCVGAFPLDINTHLRVDYVIHIVDTVNQSRVRLGAVCSRHLQACLGRLVVPCAWQAGMSLINLLHGSSPWKRGVRTETAGHCVCEYHLRAENLPFGIAMGNLGSTARAVLMNATSSSGAIADVAIKKINPGFDARACVVLVDGRTLEIPIWNCVFWEGREYAPEEDLDRGEASYTSRGNCLARVEWVIGGHPSAQHLIWPRQSRLSTGAAPSPRMEQPCTPTAAEAQATSHPMRLGPEATDRAGVRGLPAPVRGPPLVDRHCLDGEYATTQLATSTARHYRTTAALASRFQAVLQPGQARTA